MADYFDVEEILADEEEVPITFHTPAFFLAKFLHITSGTSLYGGSTDTVLVGGPRGTAAGSTTETSAGTPHGDVVAGNRTHVPLWTAIALRKRGFVSLTTPKVFSPASLRDFSVDPLAVNMNNKSHYFYELGMKVSSSHVGAEGPALKRSVAAIYQRRYLKILKTVDLLGHDFTEARDRLSCMELRLLNSARSDRTALQAWQK